MKFVWLSVMLLSVAMVEGQSQPAEAPADGAKGRTFGLLGAELAGGILGAELAGGLFGGGRPSFAIHNYSYE